MTAVTTHAGCAWDFPNDVALAYANYRGHRLVIADIQGDKAEFDAVLDEIGDCARCYRDMAEYLSGMAGSVSVALAENAGADRAAAIRQWKKGLAVAKAKLPT